jgi:hypothetical protein
MSKEELINIIQAILKTDIDLGFLLKLRSISSIGLLPFTKTPTPSVIYIQSF